MEYENDKTWLRVCEVARHLDISNKTVLKLIRNGHLRARNITSTLGKKPCWRVHVTWLEEFRDIIPAKEEA